MKSLSPSRKGTLRGGTLGGLSRPTWWGKDKLKSTEVQVRLLVVLTF